MKNKSTRTSLAPQEWEKLSDKWAHIIKCLYQDRKRICSAGLDGEAVFYLGGEQFTLKGK
jgi:hypothetical protein